jgi:HPt (histidine-containing phosphotransfer) domain-containing protein
MRWISRWIAISVVLGTFGLAGCSTNRPPVCDSVAAVQDTVAQVQNANVTENGLSQLKTDLHQLRTNLQQLSADAQTQLAPQVEALKVATNQFSASLTTARATPNAANLSSVHTAMTALQDSARHLGDAVSGTC